MAEESVTLEFVSRQQKLLLDELRALRSEVSDIRTLSLQTYDSHRRTERRVSELKDDMEVMLKAELMGSLTHLEVKIEHMLRPLLDKALEIDRLAARLADLERNV